MPTISIITIVYNGASLLEGTIQSVLAQTYPHIEYIVVDGGSTDGTVELIKKYEHGIAEWVSEPDNGLYDAMNKGMVLATGDFLWFMNAGDHIYAPETTAKMMAVRTPDTDILYGEVMLVDDARKPVGTRSDVTVHQLPAVLSWKSMKRGMVVCHQAFLPKRTIAPNYIDGNLTADIEWVIECLKRAKTATHTHLVLAEYLMGGVSKQQIWSSIKGRYRILQKHFGFWGNLWNHGVILWRGWWRWLRRDVKY